MPFRPSVSRSSGDHAPPEDRGTPSEPARIGLYLDTGIVGGAERSALHLAAAYDGPARLVVCATSPAILDEAARWAPHATRVEVPTAEGWLADFAAHLRLFRELRLDLVQVTLPNPFTGRRALLAARAAGIPTVTVEQLILPSRRRRGRLLKRSLRALTGGQVVVVGKASARRLHELFGIPMRAITVIHNGIPDVPIAPVPVARRPVIGCAARLEDQKQLEVLVDAMGGLPGIELLLIGDGERRRDLELRAAAAGVSGRTTFAGWVPDARPWIAALDVFVLPSRDEAFPLTILEAMLAGVPVVASDVGSVAEAVRDGETGLLVPSGDAGAVAAAVARLLADAATRDRVTAAAGRLARERFTADVMAAAYRRLWQRVLADAARRRRVLRPSSWPPRRSGRAPGRTARAS